MNILNEEIEEKRLSNRVCAEDIILSYLKIIT